MCTLIYSTDGSITSAKYKKNTTEIFQINDKTNKNSWNGYQNISITRKTNRNKPTNRILNKHLLSDRKTNTIQTPLDML